MIRVVTFRNCLAFIPRFFFLFFCACLIILIPPIFSLKAQPPIVNYLYMPFFTQSTEFFTSSFNALMASSTFKGSEVTHMQEFVIFQSRPEIWHQYVDQIFFGLVELAEMCTPRNITYDLDRSSPHFTFHLSYLSLRIIRVDMPLY